MGKTQVKVSDPGGVISVIPAMLGHVPGAGSVVIVGLAGERDRIAVTARVDACQVTADNADHLAGQLAAAGIESVIIVGYGPAGEVGPAMDYLLSADWPVRDAVRVESGRWFGYLCMDSACCPPAGTPLAAETEASTTLRVEAGMAPLPSRDDVAALVAVTDRARAGRVWAHQSSTRLEIPVMRAMVDGALAAWQAGVAMTDAAANDLAAAMVHLAGRDHAWAQMSPGLAESHVALWLAVCQRVPDAGIAAPGSMLAFCAWQAGNGTLGNCAVDRVLAAWPGYSLAVMFRSALAAALPPSAAVCPLTVAEVDASHD